MPVSPSSTNAMKFAVNVPTRFNRATAVSDALYNDENVISKFFAKIYAKVISVLASIFSDSSTQNFHVNC